jgi:hypothetical protein
MKPKDPAKRKTGEKKRQKPYWLPDSQVCIYKVSNVDATFALQAPDAYVHQAQYSYNRVITSSLTIIASGIVDLLFVSIR